MTDPFATALSALFASPMAVAAVYTPNGSAPLPIRVIRDQAAREAAFGQGQVLLDTNIVHIRRAEIASPASGDLITIGSDVFRIQGGASSDAEGVTWTCAIERA